MLGMSLNYGSVRRQRHSSPRNSFAGSRKGTIEGMAGSGSHEIILVRHKAVLSSRASNRESARRSREQKAQERERLIAENMDLTSQNKILSLEADELREQLRKARKEEVTPCLEYRHWVSPFAMVTHELEQSSEVVTGTGPRSESSLRSWLDPLCDLGNYDETLLE